MEKLLKIDRRIIFIFVALAVTIPLLFRFKMSVPPTRHVISMYDKIDSFLKVLMYSYHLIMTPLPKRSFNLWRGLCYTTVLARTSRL